MGTYSCSDGNRVTQKTIDRNIKKAKAKKLQNHLDEYGYFFCEDCKRSDVKPIDCSHTESVKSCKENGRTEKAWDVDNIKLLCRPCHARLDKNDVQWTHN